MKKHILTLALLFTYQPFAQAEINTQWITQDPAIFTEAKALTKTLKRDIIVYSWVPRAYVGGGFPVKGSIDSLSPSILKAVNDNMVSRMARFWDISIPISGRAEDGGAMAPNGFYVATDPIISKNYGGSNWVLYQMQLPAGMKFIDGRYRPGPTVGPNLTKALAARGCTNPLPVDSRNPVFSARNLIKSDTSHKSCRQALNDIAAAVGAASVLYLFKEVPVPTCKSVYQWSAAFVLIRPEAVVANTLRPLVVDRVNQDDGLEKSRQLINGVFQDAQRTGPFVNSSAASPAEAAKFMKDNYFSCNAEVREW